MFLLLVEWYLLNKVLNVFVIQKRARNYISFIHSLICIYKIYNTTYQNLHEISIAYFSYDIIYIICNYSKTELLYLYHHLICILMLLEFQKLNDYELYYIYGIGEVSNFFTYIVYDMIKLSISKLIVNKIKYVQVLWYIAFRVICFTYFIYDKHQSYSQMKLYNQLGGLSIYCMGILWTFNQVKNLI